ncbi:MAG TPA: type I restriction enzyme HsdR N-terminal domain-containing protein, partial [Spirochaetota bacterium]|nr:type I restriction enzyme HsdR N-terminal domain-containing protein [Spirochaetota bacterium]
MNIEEKKAKLRELVEQFHKNIKQYKSDAYDEANTRVDFIDKFFELLDWDVRNTQGYSEQYREVVREDKVKIEGREKAPDYSFRIGGVRKFFVEAKKPSVYIKKEMEPSYQIRRYGYTAKLPLSILTDFEEFAVYDTRIKPDKNDDASVARIFYCTYLEYEKNWDFIYNTFSKSAILKGSFDRYIEENKNKKGTSEVDKELLKLIEGWRTELAKNIALRNPDLDIYNLNIAVQKIIDKIIFLRIAEDKNIEEYQTLLNATKSQGVYSNLNKIFIDANKKYNGGLFKKDEWLLKLKIDDKVL